MTLIDSIQDATDIFAEVEGYVHDFFNWLGDVLTGGLGFIRGKI